MVFIGGNGTPDLQDLYSVPLAGGSALRLDTFLKDTDGIAKYAVSDNSARVVFRASDSSFHSSLDSLPIGGGSHASFAPAQPSIQGITASFFITPDSARIVFREGRQYRSAPMSGGGEVIVADDINSSAGAAYATNHRITNDSQYLIFRGQVVGESSFPLFIVPVGSAGELQRLSDDMAVVAGSPLAGSGSVIGFRSNGAGTRVIFRGGETPGASALYAVSAGGDVTEEQLLYLPLLRQ
ncbi:MAG: hypothetical protein OHK0015_35820 [Chloroflexi bacterium OHK40]